MRYWILILIALASFIIIISPASAQVCGDGSCDSGEDCSSCSEDCGACPPVCGDGSCDSGEDQNTCPTDCGDPAYCGDGSCDSNEDCSSCPKDCGSCGSVCGDGSCDSGEDCNSCSQDCGSCGPVCGDGVCDGGEDPAKCPQDCGSACGDGDCNFGEDCNSCSQDCGVCTTCGDGICEEGEDKSCPGDCEYCGNNICGGGEDKWNCPEDCGQGSCGNGVCEQGEDSSNCHDDCGVMNCGNNYCDSGENPGNCPEDCGESSYCGDGKCDFGEVASSCPEDCGGKTCPESSPCPDGSTVACIIQNGLCECPCPIPPECKEVVDEHGYKHIFCEDPDPVCPPIDSELVKKCAKDGGKPSSVMKGGCEEMECRFEGGGGVWGGDCPTQEDLEKSRHYCEEFGKESREVRKPDGCIFIDCEHEQTECPEDDFNFRRQKEEGCKAQGQFFRKDYDDRGCEITVCDYDIADCKYNVPDERYRWCEERGGEMVVKHNTEGCIEIDECLHPGQDPKFERVEDMPDSTALLQIAFKLEELIVELDKLSKNADDLGRYWESVGSPKANRFFTVAGMFESAVGEIEGMKSQLRNTDELSLWRVQEFKDWLRRFKDVTLKDIAWVLLSESEDAVRSYEDMRPKEFHEDDGFNEFNDALRLCQPAEWSPDPETNINIIGIISEQGGLFQEEKKGCELQVKMNAPPYFEMTCIYKNFPNGMPNFEQYGPSPEQLVNVLGCDETSSMIQGMKSGQGPGGPIDIPPEAKEIMEQLGCFGEDCRYKCEDAMREGDFSKGELCFKLGSMMEKQMPPPGGPGGPGEFGPQGPGEFMEPKPFIGEPKEFESKEPMKKGPCAGCLNNGICDPGECSECADCMGGY